MNTARFYLHWFTIGMGHVLGLSTTLPDDRCEGPSAEAISEDFRAVGDDLRDVMRNYPATIETAKTLGEAAQLTFAGIK